MNASSDVIEFPIREKVTTEKFEAVIDEVREKTTLLAKRSEEEYRDSGPFVYVITPRSMRQYSCLGFLGQNVRLLREVTVKRGQKSWWI